jgi:hypothetical protein
MSINPLYLSGNYYLVLFHAMSTVKNDIYLSSTIVQAQTKFLLLFGNKHAMKARMVQLKNMNITHCMSTIIINKINPQINNGKST